MNNLKASLIILVMYFAGSYGQFTDEFDFGMSEDENCMKEGMMPCVNGGCYHHSKFCDGQVDCTDGSDEDFCAIQVDNVVCSETHQFKCGDGNGCIPTTLLCNNIKDCGDGSDEVNCSTSPHFAGNKNSSCKGYQCNDGKCISLLWLCDGIYDCDDKSDELRIEVCRHRPPEQSVTSAYFCAEAPTIKGRNYDCLDKSFCLPGYRMCDGMRDCRDGSDEGPFCDRWTTMCNNHTCSGGNKTQCAPDRDGPSCLCVSYYTMLRYNNDTGSCDDVNECNMEIPQCSHKCVNGDGKFHCECDPGYVMNDLSYLCYATGPEAMLFFSTNNDIRYVKIKTKQMVTIASDIKKAHGVSYDGTYVYWVETAEGHQSIYKAQLDDVKDTKQVLVGLGLEDPGDIAVDYLGGNIYFSDAERGIISACRADGSICTTVKCQAKNPKYVTLDPRNGNMYWADWQSRAVIMSARMDGTQTEVLVDNLQSFATGLAMDAPNERLYFVDKIIKVVMIKRKRVYALIEEPFHHPYSISVFENTIFWSDWRSNSIQMTDKVHGTSEKRHSLIKLNTPIYGMHMYHPALMNATINPCTNNECSHLCLVVSNSSHVCACPDGMELVNNVCTRIGDYRPKYLVVAGEELFSRIQYDELGNPDSHATHFNIGRVQAMAYDSYRDALYIYDGQRKTINFINMTDFSLGVTHILVYEGLVNVADMDYDYATDNLYILDAGRRLIEAFSVKTQKRAYIHRFEENEVPLSLCVMPDYGKMIVAVMESDQHNIIHVDSIGLDGNDREHMIMNNIKGPHVRVRYAPQLDNVFISDESNGLIDYFHPDGTGREGYRELSSTITSLAIADNYVFWTDRRTSRLFWSDIHEYTQNIRRINLALFPNNTQLLIQATTAAPSPKDPMLHHPCLRNVCSDVCVQKPHETPDSPNFQLAHKCLCPPGLILKEDKCVKVTECAPYEFLCHKSNTCVGEMLKCDGSNDCPLGEDEEGCHVLEPNNICSKDEIFCNGICLNKKDTKMCNGKPVDAGTIPTSCSSTEYQCLNKTICISRSQLCDGVEDCPGKDDELSAECDTFSCYDSEFMCASGSCILKSWACDGEEDCNDGSDEINCEHTKCGPGFYQCRNRKCIEMKMRCDGHQDCFDYSDEEECEEPVVAEVTVQQPNCSAWEFRCEHNTSICLPPTARCNRRVECPGGSDEDGCDHRCFPNGMYPCAQEMRCVSLNDVCNNKKDCLDGADETPQACRIVKRTSRVFPMFSMGDCSEGFRCKNGECVDWRLVCNNRTDCSDNSDEKGLCRTACDNHKCSYKCQPSPVGPTCICNDGYKLSADQHSCEDIDECQEDVCAQKCSNIYGSFQCGCYEGFALRSDRHSCKAREGSLSILYVSGNEVMSMAASGESGEEYSDKNLDAITDIDYNIRREKLYITSTTAGKLIEVNSTKNTITVTNVGHPTKVAVDWVTGNVYFVDNTPSAKRIRVCHVKKKRCAILQRLPSDAMVTALIVDPSSRRMFYCVNRQQESVVWSASLSGRHVADLITVRNCTGLAVDTYKKKLYVAETGPAHIIRMDYEGDSHKKIIADQRQLQSPNGLAIFEDHIYYLIGNTFHMGRCLTFGPKYCQTYLLRSFNAHTFVMLHETVQRSDVQDGCEEMLCPNVCALDREGAVCVCNDGTLAKGEVCPDVDETKVPLFNGWSYKELSSAHSVTFAIIISVLVLVALYLAVCVYYHLIHKPRRLRPANYAEVRFQNTSSSSNTPTASNPTIEINTEGGPSNAPHEFVNPLQYVRNMWYSSFRKHRRPVMIHEAAAAAPGVIVTAPTSPPAEPMDLSDTESDMDDKELKRLF